ncbi:hypothetical protein CACET_c15510 [Clostridium aceticum]|uniref:Uncharacterized protein n=1 Tax=Clostridium aceticum TaxID=84022 RepID=A0A0D8ID63_9CLOT|nr:hypothetical protein [Clostridium aceticum]AKL95000.1 hypothetical protein CACET_c15510 [Clostridium aceticum]KJF27902.1 hypothetical protein TZ02_04810 [Clostridium aceticum]
MRAIGKRVFVNYLNKINREEKERQTKQFKELQENSCYKCPYSTWTGVKLFCMMPRCINKQTDRSIDEREKELI